MRIREWTFGVCVVATLATCAMAVPLAIDNPGFEDISGESPFNEFTFGPLNGWDLYDPGLIAGSGAGPMYFIGTLTPFETDPIGNPGVYTNFPDGAAEGARVAIAFNFQPSGGGGEYGLVQTLDDVLEPNTEYILEVEIGNIDSGTAMGGQFFDLRGFPGYRVDLLAGTTVLASDDNLLAGIVMDGDFATSTVTYTTGSDHDQFDEQLGIRLVNLNIVDPAFPGSDLEVDFDDVRSSATPIGCPGDADGDLDVDFDDLNLLLANWNGTVPAGTLGDVTGDGQVNFDDLNLVLAEWDAAC